MAKRRREPPEWWDWDLEFWEHLKERMVQRRFADVDLRLMMKQATGHRKARRAGRWILETKHQGRPWHVVVKPDYNARILEVVTAYEVNRREAAKKEDE
jgi:hypothetical protein